MDIHKPKPWHGLREFLKEYAIIVLGVLTALSAEQAADWLHWRHQVHEAEDRLAAEVESNLANSYGRVVLKRCSNERLAELRDRLVKTGPWEAMHMKALPAGNTVPMTGLQANGILTSALPPVFSPFHLDTQDGAWTSALASGVVLHMKSERAAVYARLYAEFRQIANLQDQEMPPASRMAPLVLARTLSDEDRARYLEDVGQLNMLNVVIATEARGAIRYAADAGLKLKSSTVARANQIFRNDPRFAPCFDPLSVPLSAG